MGCTGRCLEQRTTSASPDKADGELRRGRVMMVAVVMVYNVHVYCVAYRQKVELHQCDQVYTESHIPTKTNFITSATSQRIFL